MVEQMLLPRSDDAKREPPLVCARTFSAALVVRFSSATLLWESSRPAVRA